MYYQTVIYLKIFFRVFFLLTLVWIILIVRRSKINSRASAPEIRQDLQLNESSTCTIQRRLQEYGLNGRRPAKKSLIFKTNLNKRIIFAEDHVN